MNFKAFSLIKSAVAVALLGAASVTAMADSYDMKGKDVLSVAKQQGKFNTLAKAIEAAGLQDALTAQGPVTIFAPTDEAFAKLPPEQLEALLKPENKEKLVQILTNHVVPGKALTADQMKRQRGTTTLEGDQVKFELVRGRLRVNDARVTGDYDAANGSVIAVDQVLIPN
ncbi:MAG: fasciclin domain-containing protein [Steroidobacteraceae bacterium]